MARALPLDRCAIGRRHDVRKWLARGCARRRAHRARMRSDAVILPHKASRRCTRRESGAAFSCAPGSECTNNRLARRPLAVQIGGGFGAPSPRSAKWHLRRRRRGADDTDAPQRRRTANEIARQQARAQRQDAPSLMRAAGADATVQQRLNGVRIRHHENDIARFASLTVRRRLAARHAPYKRPPPCPPPQEGKRDRRMRKRWRTETPPFPSPACSEGKGVAARLTRRLMRRGRAVDDALRRAEARDADGRRPRTQRPDGDRHMVGSRARPCAGVRLARRTDAASAAMRRVG